MGHNAGSGGGHRSYMTSLAKRTRWSSFCLQLYLLVFSCCSNWGIWLGIFYSYTYGQVSPRFTSICIYVYILTSVSCSGMSEREITNVSQNCRELERKPQAFNCALYSFFIFFSQSQNFVLTASHVSLGG